MKSHAFTAERSSSVREKKTGSIVAMNATLRIKVQKHDGSEEYDSCYTGKKNLYEKYGCSFPWQSTLEDVYDYEDFIGKFLYEIYNRKIIKEQLLKHMKSE